ncbi:MAG: mannitol dehydrogenase family protein [Alphaproteobacteria bacterium]|nr:mannitol dehydrogenase family protein [Alphaproteobacteria bacterium]
MGIQLNNANLDRIRQQGTAITPNYDRSQLKTGVVHLGPSHFGRAHTLRFLDDIAATDPNWGVTMIGLRSPDVRDALKEQDNLYSLIELDGKDNAKRVIGCITDMIVAPENPQAALDAIADPSIKLVTMTVTEKGYGYDPQTGTLDFNRPDIKACLESVDEPSTAIGYLVAALEKRMHSGAPPVTVISCDNVGKGELGNGVILQNLVLAYAAHKSRELREYIENHATFPSTMVDRIVPSTTPHQKEFARTGTDIDEQWPVFGEGFKQWVIEDKFAGDMPDFASVGATIASDVNPFKSMKIRMLNGAHMALGCIGRLAGYQYVHEAIKDPDIHDFMQKVIGETTATLTPIDNVDFSLYSVGLMERLDNRKMPDELWRVVRNALTSKIQPRNLDIVKSAIAGGTEFEHLSFVTAAWIQYLKGHDDQGTEFDIVDEAAVTSGLQRIAQNSNGSPEPVMGASGVFGELQGNKEFVSAVTRHLHNIQEHGVIGAIQCIGETSELQHEARHDLVARPQPNR